MSSTSQKWRDLEFRFRGCGGELSAQLSGEWIITTGLDAERDRRRIREKFQALAAEGDFLAGGAGGEQGWVSWLDRLSAESPHFTHAAHNAGGWFRNLIIASAEYCEVRAGLTYGPNDRASENLGEVIEKLEAWRMGAGAKGGKLTVKELADSIGLDKSAYHRAKRGQPRSRDHASRIVEFARQKRLIS